MYVSKVNKFIFMTLIFLVEGCATSSYRTFSSGGFATELFVTPDRVSMECEDLYDADEKGFAGFMMYVLDEQNTVLTLVQGNKIDKESCERRLRKIGKILRNGKKIYIAGTAGDLSEPRKRGKSYLFPNKGKFESNERVLGFSAIANEYGECFDGYSGEEKPCPREPFPLKK